MSRCVNPFYNKATGLYHDCGQCPSCLNARKRDWILRLRHESEYYPDSSMMLNLTYNEEHLSSPSLVKRDYQLFIKRLRKYFSSYKIKYFVAGEYGSRGMRPHFHMILFGVPPALFDLYKPSPAFKYSVSRVVDQLWGKGFNTVGSCTQKSVSYVAGYVQKKRYGNHFDYYTTRGLLPPFSHCSRGIGRRYAESNAGTIRQNLSFTHDGFRYRVPRAYRKWLDIGADAFSGLIYESECERMVDFDTEYHVNPIKSVRYFSDMATSVDMESLVPKRTDPRLANYFFILPDGYTDAASAKPVAIGEYTKLYLDYCKTQARDYNANLTAKVGNWSMRL